MKAKLTAFNQISEGDIAELLRYGTITEEKEREELGAKVIKILQEWIQIPYLSGLEVKLVHKMEPSFLAYDKATLNRVKEVDVEKEPLTEKLIGNLKKEFPLNRFYQLFYAHSAGQYTDSIRIASIVPLVELIETIIHENLHLYFKEQPSHILYNHDTFEYGAIIEERAVEYATFKVLERLEETLAEGSELRRKIKEYREVYKETAEFEEGFYTRLMQETTYAADKASQDEIEKKKGIREEIANKFYKKTKEDRYNSVYKNFHDQIGENETDRIIAYILQRAPYVADSDILGGIEKAFETSKTWWEYAYKTGDKLLHKIAKKKHLAVPELPDKTT